MRGKISQSSAFNWCLIQILYTEASSFHGGCEFHAIFQSLQEVIDVKNVTLHKTDLRSKFTDSKRSILMDLELQIFSPSDSVPLDTCCLVSPNSYHGNLKDTRKNLVLFDAFIDRIAEKKKASSLYVELFSL